MSQDLMKKEKDAVVNTDKQKETNVIYIMKMAA